MTRDPERACQPDPDERFRVPGAEILDHDTWAEEPEVCPECGVILNAGQSRCPACGQWLEFCTGSCPSCASPRCIGGKRAMNADR